MTDFETTSLTLQATAIIASTLIGLGQIGVVWFGIRRMVAANEVRTQAGERQARRQSDLVERQERQAERRHAETMAALDAQRVAMEGMVKGMETVIARTAREGRIS